MTQQSGRYGYKPNERNGTSEQVVDKTKELAVAAKAAGDKAAADAVAGKEKADAIAAKIP